MERGVLVVGESLVDVVHTLSGNLHEYAGGSAASHREEGSATSVPPSETRVATVSRPT